MSLHSVRRPRTCRVVPPFFLDNRHVLAAVSLRPIIGVEFVENWLRNFLQIVISYVNATSFWPHYEHPVLDETYNDYCERETLIVGDLGMDRLLAILSTIVAYACLPLFALFLLNTVSLPLTQMMSGCVNG